MSTDPALVTRTISRLTHDDDSNIQYEEKNQVTESAKDSSPSEIRQPTLTSVQSVFFGKSGVR